MKTILLLTILPFLLFITVNAQITFQKTFGLPNGAGASVQQTADGGYIITGITGLGAGWSDVYLTKKDSIGNTLWTKTYGGNGLDAGSSVQQTADGGYIITGVTGLGAGSADVYLIKTDLNGDTLWTKAYGQTGWDEGTYVQETSTKGYIIAGFTSSFGAGGYDVYLIKTDSIGDTLWTKTFGGAADDFATSVHEVSDGGYMIVGYTKSFGAGLKDVYVIKTNSNGDTLWTKTFGGNSQDYTGILGSSGQPTSDGGFIITGSTGSFGAGGGDVYLIKIDSLGIVLWSKTYGGTSGDEGESVQQTIDGGYIITGRTYSFGPKTGQRNVYLIKTDAIGDTLWTRVFGDTIADDGFSVQQTVDGGYIITGRSYGFGVQGELYMIKTDSNGNSSGCYEYSTSTVMGNAATVISSGAIVSSGGSVSNPATIVGNPSFIDNVLCTSVVSIKEKNMTLSNVVIYPNPFTDYATVQFNNLSKEKHSLTLYNLMGQLVKQIDNISSGEISIERDNLNNGLYFFQLRTDSEVIGNGKAIIE